MKEPRIEYQDKVETSNGVVYRYRHYFSGKMEIIETKSPMHGIRVCSTEVKNRNHILDGRNMVEIVDTFRMLVSQMEDAINSEGDFPHPWRLDDLMAEYREKYEHHFVGGNKNV